MKPTDSIILSFFNTWRSVVWRLIKVCKDSLGSSEKGNSCYMTVWKVCCVVGVYKLWKAQRLNVIHTPLHSALLDIGFVKKKIREQPWEVLHISCLFQKADSVHPCTVWGCSLFLFSFRCHGCEILCVMLSATAEVGLCSQHGMKVTVVFFLYHQSPIPFLEILSRTGVCLSLLLLFHFKCFSPDYVASIWENLKRKYMADLSTEMCASHGMGMNILCEWEHFTAPFCNAGIFPLG